jgi:hypothetical protein
MTRNDKRFIAHVKSECKRYGVTCDLRDTTYVKLSPTIHCAGWFDSDDKRLVVSMKRNDALSILVHEYAHLTQWQDALKGKFDLWNTSATSLYRVDAWLKGKRIHRIHHHLSITRDLELDNERRSVKLIKRFGLSIDTKTYIRRANAYVHLYNWMYYTRRWCKPKNSPYDNIRVLNEMSTKFNMNYSAMSTKVYNAFYEANI